MPLYEYFCKACDEHFERLRPTDEYRQAATCPQGHASPRRVVSIFTTVRPAGASPAATAGGCACGGGGCGCGH